MVAILAALIPAALFGPQLKTVLNTHVVGRAPAGTLRAIAQSAAILALPIALYLSLTFFRVIFGSAQLPTGLIAASIALLNAWIVVRLVTLVIQSPFWSKVA